MSQRQSSPAAAWDACYLVHKKGIFCPAGGEIPLWTRDRVTWVISAGGEISLWIRNRVTWGIQVTQG